jgi:hypothetical protein
MISTTPTHAHASAHTHIHILKVKKNDAPNILVPYTVAPLEYPPEPSACLALMNFGACLDMMMNQPIQKKLIVMRLGS